MCDTRSGAIWELFRELFDPAKTPEGWLPARKGAYYLSAAVLLCVALWCAQSRAAGQAATKAETGAVNPSYSSGKTGAAKSFVDARPLLSPGANDNIWKDNDHPKNDKWSDPNNWSTKKVPDKSSDVIVNSGTPTQPVIDVSPEINTLTLNAGTVKMEDGITLTINGDKITNNKGQLCLCNTGGAGTRLFIKNKVTAVGDGKSILTMSESSNNVITGSEGVYFDNLSMIIQGAGNIGRGVLNLENDQDARITATSGKFPLIVQPKQDMINNGILESTSGKLILGSATFRNLGGTIQGGTVVLLGSDIESGILKTSNGGSVSPDPRFPPVILDKVHNQALYQINNGGRTILVNAITNDGTFSLNADQNGEAQLIINSVAALQGSGSVTLNGPNNQIKGTGTLINLQKIQGTGGTIKLAKLKNAGTISALLSNTSLTIQVGIEGIDNLDGWLETEGGTLNLQGPGTITGGKASSDNRIGLGRRDHNS